MKTTSSSPRALGLLSLILAAGLFSTPGFSQVPTEPQLPPSNHDRAGKSMQQTSRADRNFLTKAGESGLNEVAVSQIAMRRSTHPEVRAFAEKMVTAHNEVNAQLGALAARKGVELPFDDTGVKKWEKKDAEEFDEDYVEWVISAHEDAVDFFEKAAMKADDGEIRTWAANVLPALLAHVEQARALETTVKK